MERKIKLGSSLYERKIEFTCSGITANLLANIKEKDFPQFAIVLGSSGPKGLLKMAHIKKSIPYTEIGLPTPTTPGHAGVMHYASIGKIPVIICEGRVHFHEKFTMDEITMMVRALRVLGIENFVLTNASGSLDLDIKPGSIVSISDHINEMGDSPLCGRDSVLYGFFDQSNVYDKEFLKRLEKIANLTKDGMFRQQTYTAVRGPEFETPAEIQKFRSHFHNSGMEWQISDLVGMSTVPEVLAIGKLDGKVLVVSIVTNMGAGLGKKISHKDNLKIVKQKDPVFSKLIFEFVKSFEK